MDGNRYERLCSRLWAAMARLPWSTAVMVRQRWWAWVDVQDCSGPPVDLAELTRRPE